MLKRLRKPIKTSSRALGHIRTYHRRFSFPKIFLPSLQIQKAWIIINTLSTMSRIFMFWEKCFLIREAIIELQRRPNVSLLMTLAKLQHQQYSPSWLFFHRGCQLRRWTREKQTKYSDEFNFSRNVRYFNCRTWGRILFTFCRHSLHFLWFLISFSWIRKLLCTVENKIDVSRFKCLDQFICKFFEQHFKLFTFSSEIKLLVMFTLCENFFDLNLFFLPQ